eukprot:14492995-Alexandrium_andersonii.AAC.1
MRKPCMGRPACSGSAAMTMSSQGVPCGRSSWGSNLMSDGYTCATRSAMHALQCTREATKTSSTYLQKPSVCSGVRPSTAKSPRS